MAKVIAKQTKQTFGKRKVGKHKKRNSPKDKNTKTNIGQG